jgi:hypothetical protein
VPDPADRAAIGEAIDKYIRAREPASDAEKRLRSVAKPPPPSPPILKVAEPLPLLTPDEWNLGPVRESVHEQSK